MSLANFSRASLAVLIPFLCLVSFCTPAAAQFGGGHIVFDPNMFARQLQQLRQETQTVVTLAEQLKYMIKNTTGGGAGIWRSNEDFLANIGNLINDQEGLSYTVDGLTQQFEQLYPGYNAATTAGVQSPEATAETTLNTLNGALASAQSQAENFKAEQTTLQGLEIKNQTAIGNLQAVQVSNEIALAQVQQIQMLRQLVMAQMNSQNVAAADQLNKQVQRDLSVEAFFSGPALESAVTPDARHDAPPPPQP